MSDETTSPIDAEIVQWRMKIFLRSPLRRKLLVRAMRMLDKVNGQQVLEMSADDAVSVAMRNAGGGGGAVWTSLAATETQAELLAEAGIDRIHLAVLPQLPFEDGSFDAVVASDMLEYVEKPADLMAELHRTLRSKTRLILHVRRKRRTLVGWFRKLSGLTDPLRPMVHPGFTPTELFDVLKDGFDVQETAGYGRFFSEFASLLAELFAGIIPSSCEPAALNERRLRRAAAVFTVFTPFFWLAGLLDGIFFFLPDHHMVLRAKRRMMWVPRVTPRLRDGRNIAEAALGYKIGTAAE
ncbi:MAG: methyltransferase domain-containing protein [Kiritimatiellia bacterium]